MRATFVVNVMKPIPQYTGPQGFDEIRKLAMQLMPLAMTNAQKLNRFGV